MRCVPCPISVSAFPLFSVSGLPCEGESCPLSYPQARTCLSAPIGYRLSAIVSNLKCLKSQITNLKCVGPVVCGPWSCSLFPRGPWSMIPWSRSDFRFSAFQVFPVRRIPSPIVPAGEDLPVRYRPSAIVSNLKCLKSQITDLKCVGPVVRDPVVACLFSAFSDSTLSSTD